MKRILIFIYGLLSYAVFFGAFLYAIGFVNNLLVPKSMDVGGEAQSTTTAILINAVLLSIFALQHSIMARPQFKKWWTRIIPKAMERSTFVLLSSLALILMYWKWVPMTDIIWNVENTTLSNIILGVYFLGWLTVLLSTFMINHFELFGLQQIYDNLMKKERTHGSFKTGYLYAFCRHPIMLGFLIAFWATPVMTTGHLLFSVMTTVYVFVSVKYLEEKDLKKYFGETYVDYTTKVPMFFPNGKKYK